LSQFHLQLAFTGPGMSGKNVEDELGAVNHPRVNGFLNVALLGSSQVVIEQKKISGDRRGRPRDLLQFATSIRVAGSGLSRCCRNSPAICAPALVARDRNSSRDSCALNSGIRGAFEALAPLLALSRAAWAPLVRELFAFLAPEPARDRTR